jgi:SNF2 family DNA or RNA helicase
VIPKNVIRKFLNGERDDHRWIKKLGHKGLDRLLSELRPRPNYHPKLGLHQKAGLYLGIKYGSFAFWYDMGTGKTFLSLELLQYWWDFYGMRRAMVFVISDKAFNTWERQLRQYKINIPFCTLDASSSEEKWRTLDHFDEGIIFLHYPGTVAMVTGKAKVVKGRKGKKLKAKKKALDPDKLEKLVRGVDVAVFDESTKAANTGSLTYKVCNAVSRASQHRYALAGMPFGRDPMPLWAQMNLVDRGETLGKTLGLFQSTFFTEKDNYWGGPYSKIYTFKKPLRDELSRIIQHNSLTYTSDECIDLPPVLSIPEYVSLPPATKAYYQEVIDDIVSAKGNMKAMKNAFMRMRQLSSGFLGLKDDETGERAEIEFDENPKLEKLLDLLEGMAEDRKALIYYQYTVSGRRIQKAIKEELGEKSVWLWSGNKSARKDIDRFMYDPDVRFAVVQNQLGAYSLDGLQVANYEFFFETPLSVIDRKQAERRIVRQGQKHKTCFLYDLIVRDTVDEKILEHHREGTDLFKALLTNPRKILGKISRVATG